MYCNNCGKENPVGSKFCNNCGKKMDVVTSLQTENKTSQEKKKHPFLVFLLISVASFALFFGIVKLAINSDSNSGVVDKIVERDIRQSDYTVSTSQGVSSYTVTITPKYKFNSCSVLCQVYDDNGKVIYGNTITKTNLAKNNPYSFTFEFSLTVMLSADKLSYRVSGKCVG